jgi:hypothetical protein
MLIPDWTQPGGGMASLECSGGESKGKKCVLTNYMVISQRQESGAIHQLSSLQLVLLKVI